MEQTVESRPAAPVLLGYRPWRGRLGGPARGTWAIARTALVLLLRRRLFWGLYALRAMIFLFYFYGLYLQTWIQAPLRGDPIPPGSGLLPPPLKPSAGTENLK